MLMGKNLNEEKPKYSGDRSHTSPSRNAIRSHQSPAKVPHEYR
jgi:hypothetical protein